jgi:pimeloyl-ACP methyl ester carboxylesterase
MVGENDTPFRRASDVLAEEISGARLVVMPGAGHCPQEDNPAAWLIKVERHLART